MTKPPPQMRLETVDNKQKSERETQHDEGNHDRAV
jgi:hypothetical protein